MWESPLSHPSDGSGDRSLIRFGHKDINTPGRARIHQVSRDGSSTCPLTLYSNVGMHIPQYCEDTLRTVPFDSVNIGLLVPVPSNRYERYHASAPHGTIRPLQLYHLSDILNYVKFKRKVKDIMYRSHQ